MRDRATIPALQSLRGLAALVVLLHHASFVFTTSPAFHSASETLFNAHAAVELFFVLSGFVLCRAFGGSALGAVTVGRFWWRRLFRIYPTVWAGCSLTVVALVLFEQVPVANASAWFDAAVPPGQLEGANLLANFLLLKRTLVLPLWSVRVELFMALLLPFFWVLLRHRLALPLLIGTGALCLATGGINPIFSHAFAFALGASLVHFHRLAFPAAAAVAAVLVLLFFRRIDPAWSLETGFNAPIPTFVESLTAAVVIGFLGQRRGPRWLVAAPLVALGDISYSMYALHFPILIALARLPVLAALPPDGAALALMALAPVVTVPAAFLAYRWIERPGIALGQRWLTTRTAPHAR